MNNKYLDKEGLRTVFGIINNRIDNIEIPTDSLATKDELKEVEEKIPTDYVSQDELGNYQPKGNYATEEELNNYALASQLNDYALKSELPEIDLSIIDSLLEKIAQLEDKVEGYNLIGSFVEGTLEEERYVYINGEKRFLEENFKVKIEEGLTKVSGNSSFESMFSTKIKEIKSLPPLSSSCISLQVAFRDCKELTSVDTSNWNTENIKSFYQSFYYCSNLSELDLSSWKTDKVTDLNSCFAFSSKLQTLNLGQKNFENVTDFSIAFISCSNLTNVNGNINGIKVNLDLKNSPLTKESALVFLNGLAPVETTKTLTLKKSTFQLFTEEELTPYKELGWDIVGS